MKGRLPVLSVVLMWAVTLGGAGSGFGQIIITSDEIPSTTGYANAYIIETSAGMPVDLGPEGGPQVWDFSQSATGADTMFVVLDQIVPKTETPFTSQFLTANIVRRMENASLGGLGSSGGYQFEKLSAQSLDLLGFGLDSLSGVLDDPFAAELSSALTILPLPLVLGATWSKEANFTGTVKITDPQYGTVSVRLQLDYSRQGKVDAWGTLIVPAGSGDALRVRYHDTITLKVSLYGWNVYSVTIKTYSYNWYAEHMGSVASVTSRDNETNPLFTTAASIRRLTGLSGDLNDDHFITIEDAMAAIGHIIGAQFLQGHALWAADCDRDGQIDLFDALGIIRASLGIGQCEPVPFNTHALAERATSTADIPIPQAEDTLARYLSGMEDRIFAATGNHLSIDVETLMDRIAEAMRTMK